MILMKPGSEDRPAIVSVAPAGNRWIFPLPLASNVTTHNVLVRYNASTSSDHLLSWGRLHHTSGEVKNLFKSAHIVKKGWRAAGDSRSLVVIVRIDSLRAKRSIASSCELWPDQAPNAPFPRHAASNGCRLVIQMHFESI